MTDFIQEQTIDTIFSNAFKIYASKFVPLVLLYLIPTAPLYALGAIGFAGGDPNLFTIGTTLAFLMTIFVGGVAILIVVGVCNGKDVSVGEAVSQFLSLIVKYIVVYIIYIVVVAVGMILLVVPGIAAAIYFVFALVVVLVEGTGGIGALKRSAELMKGHFWRNLGILILFGLGVGIATGIFGGIIGFILGIVGVDPAGFVGNFIGNLVGVVFAPLWAIPSVLLYYDMRVRKENLAPQAG